MGQEDRIQVTRVQPSLHQSLVRAASDVEDERLATRLDQGAGAESRDVGTGRSGAKQCDHHLLAASILRRQAGEQRNGCDTEAHVSERVAFANVAAQCLSRAAKDSSEKWRRHSPFSIAILYQLQGLIGRHG